MNERKAPPNRRSCATHEMRTQTGTMTVTVGKYPNGMVADVFVDTSKEGSLLRSILSAFSIVTSVAIQHGVTVETIAKALRGFGTDEPPALIVDALMKENSNA